MKPTSSSSSRKVALVTGASAGIGKATVRRLLKDGWTVYAAARRTEQMADIAKQQKPRRVATAPPTISSPWRS